MKVHKCGEKPATPEQVIYSWSAMLEIEGVYQETASNKDEYFIVLRAGGSTCLYYNGKELQTSCAILWQKCKFVKVDKKVVFDLI